MAHFRRARPRLRTFAHTSSRSWKTDPMSTWPAHWDRAVHTRPRRREESRLLRAVTMGWLDPDGVAWPLGNGRPHVYWW